MVLLHGEGGCRDGRLSEKNKRERNDEERGGMYCLSIDDCYLVPETYTYICLYVYNYNMRVCF